MSLDRGAVDENGKSLPHGPIAEQRVLRLHAGALAFDLGPRIGAVEFDVLDVAARKDDNTASGIGTTFEPLKDLVLYLHVPRVVIFAGLDHRACRRYSVAAPLHLDRVEKRAVGHMIGRVALTLDQIAGPEIDEPVRASANRC